MPTFVVSFSMLMSGTTDKVMGWATIHSRTQRVIIRVRADATKLAGRFEFFHRALRCAR